MKVKQINQFSTGDGATYNDNRQGKHRQDVDDNEKKIIPAKKRKTTSEKRTRCERVTVPDYRELFASTNVGTSSKENENPSQENEEEVMIECSFENPSQENEEESTAEHSFENPSQENEEAATAENSSQDNEEEATTDYSFESIQDDIITDTLGNAKHSDATKEIVKIYKSQCPNGDLIDLRLKSPFLKQLPEQVATSYLKEMDDLTESLVPKNVHAFLVKFFSQNLTTEEWNCQIDDLRAPVKDDFIMNAVVRVLTSYITTINPLFNIATLEHAHFNAFVHPCLDAFLWYIAGVHYEYGEITSKNHTNGNRADGVGFMTDADNYQLVYVEGSRPITKDKKEIDVKKITDNLKNIFAKIVKETIESRQRLPEKLLSEIDNAILPRKFSEMKKFVYFYECVLKWALLVRDVTESFVDAGVEQRPSRLS
ncbi:43571_t:CDS:2, partial [Gigaspora margarita]